ncbi:MAG: hypothetical protein ABIL76_08505 [candidate division WOR-3 bacterium]
MYIGKKLYKNHKLKNNEKISYCGCCGGAVVVPKDVNDEDVVGTCCYLSDRQYKKLLNAKTWENLPFAYMVIYKTRAEQIEKKIKDEKVMKKWQNLPIYKKILIINQMVKEGKMI